MKWHNVLVFQAFSLAFIAFVTFMFGGLADSRTYRRNASIVAHVALLLAFILGSLAVGTA